MTLPIFKAVGEVFATVFGNLGELVKIAWLPLLLFYGITGAAGYYLLLPALPQFMGFVGGVHSRELVDPTFVFQLFRPMARYFAVALLTGMVCLTMVRAGLLKFFLHGERTEGFFYLQFGADEWRLLGTFVLEILILVGVEIGGLVAIFALTFVARSFDRSAAVPVFTVGGIALLVTYFWVVLRLCLALPASIAVRGIGIGPSWSTTKGNVWHLLGYWIVWLLIIVLVELVLALLLGGFDGDLMSRMSEMRTSFAEPVEGNPFLDRMLKFVVPIDPAQLGVRAAIEYVIGLIGTCFGAAIVAVPYRLIAGNEGTEV